MKKTLVTLLNGFTSALNYTTSDKNKSITESIPALGNAVEITFSGKVAAIQDLIGAQNEKIKGAAAQKNNYKKSAAKIAMTVINRAKSFATAESKASLLGKIDYSYTALYRIKDAEFAAIVIGLMALLSPLVTDLEPYGITQNSIDEVIAAATLYAEYRGEPRQQKVDRKSVNGMLNKMFTDANDFQRNIIDPLVFGLSETQIAYVTGYRIARRQQPIGSRHTRLIATVVNELGQPYLCTVKINSYIDPKTKREYAAKSSTTDINGIAEVFKFHEGIRSITISGNKIETTTFSALDFKKGKTIEKTFVVKPAFANLPSAKITAGKSLQQAAE